MNQALEVDAVNSQSEQDSSPRRFQDVIALSDEDVEAIYRVAFNMYQQDRFEDAEKFFGYLCICDATSERFFLALGMARQKRENYTGAYDAYLMAGSAHGNSPRPPLFAAECALHFGQIAWAQSALLDALKLAENDHDPDGIKSRIAALQYGLNRRLETE